MKTIYSSLLQSLIEWTDQEISLGKKFLDWEEVTINWENLNLHWEDIFIILKKRGSNSSGDIERGEFQKYIEGNPWRKMQQQFGDDESEKIIKVLCKINGIEYDKILENKQNIRILVNDFIRNKELDQINVKVKL